MKHTFLIEPGRWRADGRNIDAAGEEARADGEAVFTHRPDVWVNDSWMRVEDTTFHNRYEFHPLGPGELVATFRSLNPAIGPMHGRYTFIGDAILVEVKSDDGAYSGAECLLQIDADTYRDFGAFYKGKDRMGSWEVMLRRAR